MTAPTGITISVGLPEALRQEAAALYLDAFGKKLRPILGRDPRAVTFLAAVQRPANAVVAIAPSGGLLGLAGFHDATGGFIGGGFSDMAAAFGTFGAIWRGLAFSIFEREAQADELLMDGVVVSQIARGQGIGTMLLDRIETLARDQGKARVRLDVVDTNPRARALYERRGYRAVTESGSFLLRPIFGFSRSITMERALAPNGVSYP